MIKFVYFDLGGVTMLDYSGTHKWQEMKRDMGITTETDATFEAIWKRHAYEVCTKYDVDNLIPTLTSELKIRFSPDYSLLVDFANRFERNLSIWPIIEKIHVDTKVGLLTNMYPRMFDALKSRGILPPIEWDAIIDSSLVHCQKPEPEIYAIAEAAAQTKVNEILFVDNIQVNLDTARSIGWQTFLYDSTKPEKSSIDLMDFFEKNK